MMAKEERARALDAQLREEAEGGGYNLNPDQGWTLGLASGLLVNEERYGYRACPCRLASGDRASDTDIICPCDYRDLDLHEYGACYCALYVSDEVLRGERELRPVPERRPDKRPSPRVASTAVGVRLWRCRVCGYLCAREHPPGVCPVCRAKADRFEEFVLPPSALPGG